MTADQLFQYLSWALYATLFVIALVRAVRQPRRANIDIALLFGFPAISIAIAVVAAFGAVKPGPIANAVNTSILFGLGFLLLRLVDDFAIVPRRLMQAAAAGLVLLSLGTFLVAPPRPLAFNLLSALYLICVIAYATVAFIRQSARARGVTRRRMSAVAIGSLSLVLLFILGTLSLFAPQYAELWRNLVDITALASGLGFFIGFAPPRWLRRAWQEPELRAFLGRAASLPRLPDTASILRELERGAADSVGAPNATLGLWDETAQVLRFTINGEELAVAPDDDVASMHTFRSQQARFEIAQHDTNPTHAAVRRTIAAHALLLAPVTAGARRLGVLSVFAPRAPIFADDDLALVQLLADQAAVILESRALIDEAARVQAREQATRLKEDFLSAAAHDLKTPLTTLVARAQLLERRILRNPHAPVDLGSIQLIVQEGQRLRRLVLELLDAARTEQGRLVGDLSSLDLAAVAREICVHRATERHQCVLVADAPVVGEYDEVRIMQLLENLLENAIKYSPDGGTIRVKVWREQNSARLSVTDSGIGIPANDLPFVFDRFYRAGNVDDRRFAGMGLGLFICRGIVEQHGGRIWATSRPGEGSTFEIALPLVPVGAAVYA
jgi:signal transduction histidine kinase